MTTNQTESNPKTAAVLAHLEGLFASRYPGKTEMAAKAMDLYRQAISRETFPSFESQVSMDGQTEALRNLMRKHQDIYIQIKSLNS